MSREAVNPRWKEIDNELEKNVTKNFTNNIKHELNSGHGRSDSNVFIFHHENVQVALVAGTTHPIFRGDLCPWKNRKEKAKCPIIYRLDPSAIARAHCSGDDGYSRCSGFDYLVLFSDFCNRYR